LCFTKKETALAEAGLWYNI